MPLGHAQDRGDGRRGGGNHRQVLWRKISGAGDSDRWNQGPTKNLWWSQGSDAVGKRLAGNFHPHGCRDGRGGGGSDIKNLTVLLDDNIYQQIFHLKFKTISSAVCLPDEIAPSMDALSQWSPQMKIPPIR